MPGLRRVLPPLSASNRRRGCLPLPPHRGKLTFGKGRGMPPPPAFNRGRGCLPPPPKRGKLTFGKGRGMPPPSATNRGRGCLPPPPKRGKFVIGMGRGWPTPLLREAHVVVATPHIEEVTHQAEVATTQTEEVATGPSGRRVGTPHPTHHPTVSRRTQSTHGRAAGAGGRGRDRGWSTHRPRR